MSNNPLNDISRVYLEQIAEKKDDSYLETDMEKRRKNNEKAVEDMKKTKAHKDMVSAARKHFEEVEIDEASYSAKAARAGKDIGKPGKQFAKIAKSAAERYGSKERGEKVAGAVLAKLRKEALDPVGHEDKDIDNDGDHDKTDKYLLNRRKVRGAAISKKKMKESFSNWRQDLSEVMDDVEAKKEIKEKKVNNKITINPDFKESVENMGGQLIEMVEIEEVMTMKDFKKQRSRQKQKDKRAADKIAPNRRSGIHADKASPERAARHRANVDPDFEGDDESNYPGGKLRAKKVRKAKALGELGEAVYGGEKQEQKDTRYTVTAADKKGNTAAYQKYKAGDKRYKAAPHLGEEVLDEKALSQQQQKFMGMVYAVKKGEMAAPSAAVAKAAAGMSKKSARDFAKTKHEGLPKKVEEQMDDHIEPTGDKKMEQQRQKIQMQKVRDLTTRLQAARKGVY
jgi:hypothetical protein